MRHELLIDNRKIIVFAKIKGVNEYMDFLLQFENIKFDFVEKIIEI